MPGFPTKGVGPRNARDSPALPGEPHGKVLRQLDSWGIAKGEGVGTVTGECLPRYAMLLALCMT